MTIAKTEREGVSILELEGRLDTTTAPDFQTRLLEELAGGDAVTLDFEKLVYVSSAGLRALLAGQKAAAKRRADMVLTHVSSEIMEVFRMTGFSEILTIR